MKSVKKIKRLLQVMREKQVDWYIVPTSDFHDSEYVSPYFQARSHFSGFTGSAGTLVAGAGEQVLFTDGRYFIQAQKELEGSGITLMRSGMQGVPTIQEYLKDKLRAGETLAVDGRLISAAFGEELAQLAKERDAAFTWEQDLTALAWENRPALVFHPLREMQEAYFGQTREEKIKAVRQAMGEAGAEAFVLTSLDDIAWLFNIRGSDVDYNPVVFAYAVVTKEEVLLFAGEPVVQVGIPGITCKDYFSFYTYLKQLPEGISVMVDTSRVNYAIVQYISKKGTCISRPNPTTRLKAIKNKVEIENTKQAHIADGVAVTKFMYWLKNNIGKQEITEVTAAAYLEALRRKNPDCFDLSFETICAYNENAAMMHYSATEDNYATLKPQGLLLVDSGGQYVTGTTDITRTFVLGPVSDAMKRHFTMTAKAMLRLENTRFLYGCTGVNLDIMARGIMWQENLDYQCGTGHGVGHILNVHEGPNAFRWKLRDTWEAGVLEAGMITTDEPGVYLENAYGIRLENELLCVKGVENEYGQFMEFEPLTYVPIDLDGIDINILSVEDVEALNQYHQAVYEKISPYLTEEERIWLQKYTKNLKK